MELIDFFENIEAHPELEGLSADGVDAKEPAVTVRHTPSQLTTRAPVHLIEELSWDVIEEVLTGKRNPQALQHMTRVVGYFSRVENWNKSKVGELKDRRKGDYALPAEAPTT